MIAKRRSPIAVWRSVIKLIKQVNMRSLNQLNIKTLTKGRRSVSLYLLQHNLPHTSRHKHLHRQLSLPLSLMIAIVVSLIAISCCMLLYYYFFSTLDHSNKIMMHFRKPKLQNLFAESLLTRWKWKLRSSKLRSPVRCEMPTRRL